MLAAWRRRHGAAAFQPHIVQLEDAEILLDQLAAQYLLALEDRGIEGIDLRVTGTTGLGIGPDDNDFTLPDPHVLLLGGFVQGVGELLRHALVEPDIEFARQCVAHHGQDRPGADPSGVWQHRQGEPGNSCGDDVQRIGHRGVLI